uniref:(northern house mosquito) hypothetical protein n=1 Tax=Culex pipiens TaxID=7175 RepID=A0A8D8FWH5_CULPI
MLFHVDTGTRLGRPGASRRANDLRAYAGKYLSWNTDSLSTIDPESRVLSEEPNFGRLSDGCSREPHDQYLHQLHPRRIRERLSATSSSSSEKLLCGNRI